MRRTLILDLQFLFLLKTGYILHKEIGHARSICRREGSRKRPEKVFLGFWDWQKPKKMAFRGFSASFPTTGLFTLLLRTFVLHFGTRTTQQGKSKLAIEFMLTISVESTYFLYWRVFFCFQRVSDARAMSRKVCESPCYFSLLKLRIFYTLIFRN
jgi:hypothetical protein